MSCDDKVDCGRRRLLVATAAAGGVAGVATVVPFVASMLPSERAKSAGAPVEVDISKLAPGQMMTVEWRGKPVWIINRTKEMLASLKKVDEKVVDPNSEKTSNPTTARTRPARSSRNSWSSSASARISVARRREKFKTGAESGVDADWAGGFLCPCHGSTFDLAGRVYKGKPAPDNLEVPPHMYLSDAKILIGEDKKGA